MNNDIKRIVFAVSMLLAAQSHGQAVFYTLELDDVDAGAFVHHSYTSLTIDADQNIHVSYRGGGRQLKYATNKSGIWVPEVVFESSRPVARESAIALDSAGLAHISFSYSDGSAEDLMYARQLADGGWEVVTVFSAASAGMENDIAIDLLGHVHISHWQWNGSELLYSTNASGDWTTVVLDEDASWDRTSIAVTSSDEVHIVYSNTSGIVHRDLAAGKTSIVDPSVSTFAPCLAAGESGVLHVSYMTSGGTSGSLKHASKSADTWETSVVSDFVGSGRYHCLEVDQFGGLHVVFRDSRNGQLVYGKNLSGTWETVTIEQFGDSYSGSLGIDAGGVVHISYRYSNLPESNLYSIWGHEASSTFFMSGANGVVLKYENGHLDELDLGATASLFGISGSGPEDVVAVGSSGTTVHFDGQGWNFEDSGTSNSLYSVWVQTPTSIFAVGASGTILFWDGVSWTNQDSGVSTHLFSVWGASSKVFAVGQEGLILEWDGEKWSPMNSGSSSDLHGVTAFSESLAFAVGDDNTILKYNGESWSSVDTGTPVGDFRAIWGSSEGEIFVSGRHGLIVSFDGETWLHEDLGAAHLYGIAGATGSELLAVGDRGWVYSLDDGDWNFLSQPKLRLATTDLCEGKDSTGDSDLDGICDDIDLCEGNDASLDTDEDGVCDDLDKCPGFDDTHDADADGIPDGCDACPGFDDSLDADADGVPDGCDACPGFDDSLDADADGVPDGCDACPGFDDAIDADADGVPDGCDQCQGDDNTGDSDQDGICNDQDICFGDNGSGDGDGDGQCANVDCDDSDPTDTSALCVFFEDDFESGDTSGWSHTVGFRTPRGSLAGRSAHPPFDGPLDLGDQLFAQAAGLHGVEP